ncbi:MAG: carbohydrate kinase [Bacteroidales bacterium]|nr:carbohydrate kinase [Bacteroidales bacterium]
MSEYIVGIGEVLWDVFPTGKKLGGAPANFAYHVSQFGLEGLAVSAVGRDPLGEETVSALDEHGLHYHIDRVEEPTGTVQVTLDDKGVPQYEIKTGVAWDNIPFTEELSRIAASTKAVCFGSLAQRGEVSRQTIGWFLDAVPADCMKVFDINLRQSFYSKEIIEDSLRRADILKINEEEIVTVAQMFGIPETGYAPVCRKIMEEYSLKMLILTCGAVGSYVFYDGGMSYIDTPKVKVADTVGAGDSFTGAFVASILQGKSVEEAHRIAVGVSAYVCTMSGAMPLVPPEVKGM